MIQSVVFAAVTFSRLNYRIFDRSRTQGVITNERGLLARLIRRLVYIVDPQRRKTGNSLVSQSRDGQGVSLLAGLVAPNGCFDWFRSVRVVSMVLTFMAATSVTSWGVETIGGVAGIDAGGAGRRADAKPASGLISGERDSGGWELLRMTPLSSCKIVIGKMLSVAWTLLLVLMATLPGYLMMIMIQPEMSFQVRLVLICLLWIAIYALAVSSAVGSLFRYTAVSTAVDLCGCDRSVPEPHSRLAWLAMRRLDTTRSGGAVDQSRRCGIERDRAPGF